jgi:hypothetical protein
MRSCAGYIDYPPGFVGENDKLEELPKEYHDPNPSFRHIFEKPGYKKLTFESRLFRHLLKMLFSAVPTGKETAIGLHYSDVNDKIPPSLDFLLV